MSSISSLKLLTAALVVALSLAFGSSVALADHDSGGVQPGDPAYDNCSEVIDKQSEKGTTAGGGPKEGVLAPTNCDHFFNTP